MKDAKGHGSAAAHQAGVEAINPSIAEGRDLYAHFAARAFAQNPHDHSGFSKADLHGWSGGTNQGGHYK